MISPASPQSTSPKVGLAACIVGLPEMVPVTRGAGFDFLLLDMEHGRITIDALTSVCIAGLQSGFPVLARVTGPSSPDLARVLDCGATGVVVPHVDSVEQTRSIVAACRFAPLGARAIPGPLAVLNFEPTPPARLIDACEAQVQVHAMIESCAGLAAAREIAQVPGVTGLIIGANDLAASLGHTGNVPHPEVQAAFVEIATAAADAGIGFGVMGLPATLLNSYGLDLGANFIVVTNEINLLVDGARASVKDVRSLCEAHHHADPQDAPV